MELMCCHIYIFLYRDKHKEFRDSLLELYLSQELYIYSKVEDIHIPPTSPDVTDG